MTDAEAAAHFNMWAMMASPLIAGNDLRAMPSNVHDILTNRQVIAVNQDPLGAQARTVRADGELEVWSRPLVDGSTAVALFNRSATSATITTSAAECGAGSSAEYWVRDLWTGHEYRTSGELSAEVPAHGVTLLRVRPNS